MGETSRSFRWGGARGTKRKRSFAQKQQTRQLAQDLGGSTSTSSLTSSDAGKENTPIAELQKAMIAQDAIAKTIAIDSVAALDTRFQLQPKNEGYLSVPVLDLQLDWHIANAVKESADSTETSASGIPKAKTGANGRKNREARYQLLRTAISRRCEIIQALGGVPILESAQPESDTEPMDVDEEGYDSEEQWYSDKRTTEDRSREDEPPPSQKHAKSVDGLINSEWHNGRIEESLVAHARLPLWATVTLTVGLVA
ncbi:hypothetical protein B0H13DRAFT_1907344 [Mycena leptocephala]|nr:hypothetical protein B0H13DRAFT_1907344 [Mycena leptocephala]